MLKRSALPYNAIVFFKNLTNHNEICFLQVFKTCLMHTALENIYYNTLLFIYLTKYKQNS